jgi:aminomethyltransferase
MPLFETCIHDCHVKLGAKMVDFAGWHMPIQYTSIVSEHKSVRERVGIFDVSHMGQIFVSGKDASTFLSYVTTWDMSRLLDGDCRYCHILNEDGQIIDDTIVYTFSSDNFMLVPNASTVTKIFDWLNLK